MNEDFLHFIWQFQRFNHQELNTTQGEALQVVHPGRHNKDAGPDFFNGRIRIAGTLWAGNIEIHLKASDWYKHSHQEDAAYSQVILHVVWEMDTEVYDQNGVAIPCLALNGRVSRTMLAQFLAWQEQASWIPCENQFNQIDKTLVLNFANRLYVERLQRKSEEVNTLLERYKGDWEQTLFYFIMRSLDPKVNVQPFELLSTTIPIKNVHRFCHSQIQLEALFLGQAGFLSIETEEPYCIELIKEYKRICSITELNKPEYLQWKFAKMRPGNFPSLRLAQLANIYHKHASLFQYFTECKSIKEYVLPFQIPAAEFWNNRFHLNKLSKVNYPKKIGASTQFSILVNAVLPVLFTYAKKQTSEEMVERCLAILEQVPPENNRIIRGWKKLKILPIDGLESQGLIELKNRYCDLKKCLNCPIGNAVLKAQDHD